MKTTNTIPLVAALLGLASANPGIFDDIKSDWDGAKSDIKAEASTLKSDWDAGWSSATATHTKTSSSAAPTATSLSHNVTTLTYPRCSPDSSRAWCGIVVGGTNSTYNVSITDSACKQLTTKSNIKEDATPISFSTDVGSWTFGVRGDNGLNMTYNGRNVSDFQAWDSWAIETLDYESDTLVMYGGITNCTAADKEKKDDNDDESGAMKVGVSGMGMAVALAAVAVGMAGLF